MFTKQPLRSPVRVSRAHLCSHHRAVQVTNPSSTWSFEETVSQPELPSEAESGDADQTAGMAGRRVMGAERDEDDVMGAAMAMMSAAMEHDDGAFSTSSIGMAAGLPAEAAASSIDAAARSSSSESTTGNDLIDEVAGLEVRTHPQTRPKASEANCTSPDRLRQHQDRL